MAETEKETGPEKTLPELIETVHNFTPEQILSPEKRKQIGDWVRNGLDLIARGMSPAGGEDQDWGEALLLGIPMNDFVRASLTEPPLPLLVETGSPTPVAQADGGYDWWGELSAGQKNAFWQILREDFGLDKEEVGKPIEAFGVKEYRVIRSEMIITVPATQQAPESCFQPVLVFDPSEYPLLACVVLSKD